MSLRAPLALVLPVVVTLISCGAAVQAPPPAVGPESPGATQSTATAAHAGTKPANMNVAMDSSECRNMRGDETTVALFKKGCDGGDATGCHELFARYMCGVGVPQDSQAALAAATKACDLGLIEACANAGMLLGNGGGDKGQARKLLEKGCAGNDVAACNNLGTMDMMSGDGQGPVKAAALFQKLCDKGNVMSCANLAQIFAVGLGDVPMDQARARSLAEGACARDNFVACNVMGIVLFQGTPSDPSGSAKAWTKACELGAPASCDNLGQLYQRGVGVEQDVAQATNLYRKACSAGVPHACTALGQLGATANVQGTGVTNTTF